MRKPVRFLVILFLLAVWPPAWGVHDAESSVPSKSGTAQTVYPISVFYRKQLVHRSAKFTRVSVARMEEPVIPSAGHRQTSEERAIGVSPGGGSLYALMSLQL